MDRDNADIQGIKRRSLRREIKDSLERKKEPAYILLDNDISKPFFGPN